MSSYRRRAGLEPRTESGERVRAVDPPADPATDAERARREGAKLMASEMGRHARERERTSRVVRALELVVDVLGVLWRW